MYFLGCNGTWQKIAQTNAVGCSGELVMLTAQELQAVVNSPALTTEETAQLLDATLLLFATVFGFLVLKKVL